MDYDDEFDDDLDDDLDDEFDDISDETLYDESDGSDDEPVLAL